MSIQYDILWCDKYKPRCLDDVFEIGEYHQNEIMVRPFREKKMVLKWDYLSLDHLG